MKSRVGLKPLTPEWNLTPLRRWNSIVLPSGEIVQLSARPGITLVVPRSNSVSLSKTGMLASKLVPVVLMAGEKFSGEPSEQ